ncbi:hypothetical protein PRK78_005754 [Emydomyces testavorans]|uniref:Uncharacterized protein n=1 Tax=Emydomyces testavorans TaxID=2070801 RepID=A0AAF0IMX7_9EURO|nr:hypothetical protein PRK78_005754 [Emydomyces testavorans]
MRFSYQLLGGTALTLLLGLASSFDARWMALQKKLEIAARLGLSAESVFDDPDSVQNAIARIDEGDIPAETIQIPNDHKNPRNGTYKNRFWVNDSKYKPGGPVFVYDAGEGFAQYDGVYHLKEKTSFFYRLLEEFHGVGIVWEHRYYGESFPFPRTHHYPAKNLRFLTFEQALADLPYFAKTFKRKTLRGVDLTPKSTPWIMVGGSYPGVRAAVTRNKYPDTIFAAFASSATVQNQLDVSFYFERVYNGLVAYGYGNCTKDIRAAYSYIDKELDHPDSAARVKRLFMGPSGEKKSNGEFAQALSYIYTEWQSYGPKGGLGVFCDFLETDPETNKTAPAEGWAPVKGAKAVAERFAKWDRLPTRIRAAFETNCKNPDDCDGMENATGESYTWQTCSEFGLFFLQNQHAIVSKYLTEEFFQNDCYKQIPDGLSSGYLPRRPKVNETLKFTDGWHMRPSNVYWSAGQWDPWTSITPLSDEDWAPKINVTTVIPECNVPPPQSEIFGYVIPNGYHCVDFFDNEFKQAQVSTKLFSAALHKWLPCFKKKD